MNAKGIFFVAAIAGLLLASQAGAVTISGNWCSVAQIQTYPAGLLPASNWNDYTSVNTSVFPGGYSAAGSSSVASGAAGDVILEDTSVAPAGVVVDWSALNGTQNTNDNVDNADLDGGNDELMRGYIQSGRETVSTPRIILAGEGMDLIFDLAGGETYDVIVYFDGNGDVLNTLATPYLPIQQLSAAIYEDSTKATQFGDTLYARDTDDFGTANGPGQQGTFIPATSTTSGSPTEGANYVIFQGLSSPTFFVEILGAPGLDINDDTINNGGHGVALNGFQITSDYVIPEPMTMVGLASAGIAAAGYLRRRRLG